MKTIKQFYIISVLIVVIFVCIIVYPQYSQCQYNSYINRFVYDRVPAELFFKSLNQKPVFSLHPKSSAAVVTDDNGFDNFYLGVDFAQPHISVNPCNPKWFFTSFNTNNPYSTYDALNWFRIIPNFSTVIYGTPVTAYDSLGNLYCEILTGTGASITGTRIVKSTNNGLTWQNSVPGNVGVDKNWIAADQTGGPYANYVYSVMTSAAGYGNFFRSTNKGASFTNTTFFSTQSLPGIMVAVGPRNNIQGGSVYVVTNSGDVFASTYTFYLSIDGGASFTSVSSVQYAGVVGDMVSGRHSVKNMRTRPFPLIAADNSYGAYRGRLYLVYATNNPPGTGNKPDIYCRYSTNQGTSWSGAVMINDDVNTTSKYQWHPAIWCDKKTGRLYANWLDTRLCPTNDSCDLFSSYSDNGGVTWAVNKRISNKTFKIDCPDCGGSGTPRYQGDYNSVVSNEITSMPVWTDFRNSTFGSYTAFFPDFAMKIKAGRTILSYNDSIFIKIYINDVKHFNKSVRFSVSVDTIPTSGSFGLAFVNGLDSMTGFPDSLTLRVKSIGIEIPVSTGIVIKAAGLNGTPVHQRIQEVTVGLAPLNIGTDRDSICEYRVNGIPYTTRQTFTFDLGSTVNVKAVSPFTAGAVRYIFRNWSDAGDTTHIINMSEPRDLTAFYKTQFKLTLNSFVGNSFGGGVYYDSASTASFGVYSKFYTISGVTYRFMGWDGIGNGSYTSPDSLGNDTTVNIFLRSPVTETARWQPVTGVIKISGQIPYKFELNQNYPNPFNPSTVIRYSIPSNCLVTLKVYNILGKEIAVLVNELQNAGYYETRFQNENLPGGIYFYKISAPGFTEVRRMVLIK